MGSVTVAVSATGVVVYVVVSFAPQAARETHITLAKTIANNFFITNLSFSFLFCHVIGEALLNTFISKG